MCNLKTLYHGVMMEIARYLTCWLSSQALYASWAYVSGANIHSVMPDWWMRGAETGGANPAREQSLAVASCLNIEK
jgi:hypothetical protein